MVKWIAPLVVLLAAPAFAGSDPDDAEGTKDHPEISRFPGYWITQGEPQDFNAYEFVVKRNADDEEVGETKEGRYWRLNYSLKEGARRPSTLELTRNYENALKKLKATLLFKNIEPNYAKLTFKMPVGKIERFVEVEAHDNASSYYLTVVEVAGMQQTLEFSSAEMKDALDRDGFLALYGIQFDTGKDALKPESEPLLAEIVTLLKNNAALSLSVEGHTDNVGNAQANGVLSAKRAESVKKWLVARGIPAKRLTSAGFGDSKPVADNRTEDGRSKNRRVELVKKK